MKFGPALLPFLIGLGESSSSSPDGNDAIASSSSSSSYSSASDFLDIFESINEDAYIAQKNKMLSVVETKNLDSYRLKAVKQNMKLGFDFSSTLLKNKRVVENKVTEGDKNGNNKNMEKVQNQKHEQVNDFSGDNVEKIRDTTKSTTSTSMMDIDYGNLRHRRTRKDGVLDSTIYDNAVVYDGVVRRLQSSTNCNSVAGKAANNLSSDEFQYAIDSLVDQALENTGNTGCFTSEQIQAYTSIDPVCVYAFPQEELSNYNQCFDFVITVQDFGGACDVDDAVAGIKNRIDYIDRDPSIGGLLADVNFNPSVDFCLTSPPTKEPTISPTKGPIQAPVPDPTQAPVPDPTQAPVPDPTQAPVPDPTDAPTPPPTDAPTPPPTNAPTPPPTDAPIPDPTDAPTKSPPTSAPTCKPCVNDPDFEFIFYNKKGVPKPKGGCDHVAKKPKKRCKKMMGNPAIKIKFSCPVTCNACPACP